METPLVCVATSSRSRNEHATINHNSLSRHEVGPTPRTKHQVAAPRAGKSRDLPHQEQGRLRSLVGICDVLDGLLVDDLFEKLRFRVLREVRPYLNAGMSCMLGRLRTLCALTSVSMAPGHTLLTRTGARSIASPRVSASNAPSTPMRRLRFGTGFRSVTPGTQSRERSLLSIVVTNQ